MKKEIIGANAGIVWSMLSAKDCKMNFSELLMNTELSPIELAFAIGWLAREDKIMFFTEDEKDYIAIFRPSYY